MKIYTKKGDRGTTGLFGGTRLPKHHIRIQSYGAVDELNSFVGSLTDMIEYEEIILELRTIQNFLFVIGSHLAADPSKENLWLPKLDEGPTKELENAIDHMETVLPGLKNFILPGGHVHISQSHICRSVCRRAERDIVALAEIESVPSSILEYMNRLSDYFFVLARYLGHLLGTEEIPWISRDEKA